VNYASLTSNGTVTAKAVNAIGASAARVRTVQRQAPIPPSSLSGQRYAICPGNTYNYNFAAAEATSYLISAPVGSIVKSANFPGNTLNVLSTTETSFSVVFPEGYVSGSGLVQVFSVNACLTSATSKGLTIYTTPERPATVSGSTTISCGEYTYTTPTSPLVSAYNWTAPAGATIVSGQGTNSVVISFSNAVATSSTLLVRGVSLCGVDGPSRSVALTKQACVARGISAEQEVKTDLVTYSELYPNPSSNSFNIDINAETTTEVTIVVYAFNGNVVSEEKHNLQKGNNTINTNTSRLPHGLYVVRFVNPTTNTITTKKFFKR
jgi:hypothetical protein